MASIIKASIDLNKIPKDKIFVGKKGKYLPFLPTKIFSLGMLLRLILVLIILAILIIIYLVKHSC